MRQEIKVERETYRKNGKEFYTYFIKGKIRGKEVKIAVVPPDVGGYTVLDIVFDTEMAVDLIVTPLRDQRRKRRNYFRKHLLGAFFR